MNKFRLISRSGDGVGLAHRLMLEGHSVDFWLKDPKGKNLYEGILPRVDDWKKGLTKDTVLVFDMSGMGEDADKMRSAGYPVVGTSKLADELELDRTFGLAVSDNHGIETPEWEEFEDFDSAIEYLQDQEDAFVFKPNDNREGVRTFVSQSPEQMIAMLEHYKELGGGGKFTFVLQKIVEGVEVSSEVWCVEGEIIPGSYNNTLEQKRFLNGDLGPNTGCMGSTVKFNLCPRLFDETFGKLKPWLKAQKFNGPIDINCIVDDTGVPFMLEWTPRFGYSAIYAMLEGLEMPVGEFLSAVAAGETPELLPLDEWCGSLRLTMPPYPHCEDAPDAEGLPIIGLDLINRHVWPLDLMVRDGKMLCSGFDSIVAEISGHDESLQSLWYTLIEDAKEIQIPELQYRTDIFADVSRRVNQLIDLEYCDSVELVEESTNE
jgi:phosphoribosylamine---glycine ligase